MRITITIGEIETKMEEEEEGEGEEKEQHDDAVISRKREWSGRTRTRKERKEILPDAGISSPLFTPLHLALLPPSSNQLPNRFSSVPPSHTVIIHGRDRVWRATERAWVHAFYPFFIPSLSQKSTDLATSLFLHSSITHDHHTWKR